MDNREAAVQGVVEVATNQPGLVLSFTKEQADRLSEVTSVAERVAANFAINIQTIVGRLNVLGNIVEQIKDVVSYKSGGATDSPQVKIDRISSILMSGGNEYALEESKAEAAATTKPSVSGTVVETTNSIAKASMGVAGLAMLIPLLVSNPQIVDVIKGFFTGFLEGVGVSTEKIKLITPAVGVILGILGAFFTVKALAPVVAAFQSLKRLAEVLGIAGQIVGEAEGEVKKKDKDVKSRDKTVKQEQEKIDKEKDSIKKGTDAAKDEVKQSKDEIKKAKDAGKTSKTKIGKMYEKLKALSQKVAPRLTRMVGNIVRAIPVVGTVLGIGFLLYDLFGIGKDVYDVMFGDDEEKVEPESKPVPAATGSTPSSATPTQKESAPPASTTPSAPAITPTSPPSSTPSTTPEASALIPMHSNHTATITASAKVDQMERDDSMNSGSFVLNVQNNNLIQTAKKVVNYTPDVIFSTTVGV